jgi:hypothetical protein
MSLEGVVTSADDSMDHCHRHETAREKLNRPVEVDDSSGLEVKQAEKMIEFAWFENPHHPAKIPVWDEATIRKGCETLPTNGCHQVTKKTVRNLVEFASLY